MKKPLHQLRAGVIGTGFIGPVHIEALKRLGVQVTAICGSTKNARATAQAWGIPEVYGDYDYKAMMKSPNVDVVHITSPNKVHIEQSLAALEAGKHVVCEKPLGMHTRETLRLVKAVKKAGRKGPVFAVNYMCRFFPAVLQMKAMVERGDLGQIINVQGHFFQDWLLQETDYNWRIQASEGGSCVRWAISARIGSMQSPSFSGLEPILFLQHWKLFTRRDCVPPGRFKRSPKWIRKRCVATRWTRKILAACC